MTEVDTNMEQHSPQSNPRRPKGILKNSNSYSLASPDLGAEPSPSDISQPLETPPPTAQGFSLDGESARRPPLGREVSEKEVTLQNTLANAGPRRNSSNARSSMSASRRHSSAMDVDDAASPRLKWDEANLYHNEQLGGATMRIDEPKTPFVREYDPSTEMDDEIETINAKDIVVDELERANTSGQKPRPKRTESIPDLDLGEPEEDIGRLDSGEKKVIVENGPEDGATGHGEEDLSNMTAEERKKHREFEERRKRHYEVPPGLLSHPEDEVEEDDSERATPAVPAIPK